MPAIIMLPRSIAIMTFVGIPRLKVGMKLACAAELLQDSGPAIPSMAPVPNFLGFLESFFSTL